MLLLDISLQIASGAPIDFLNFVIITEQIDDHSAHVRLVVIVACQCSPLHSFTPSEAIG